MDKQLFIRPQAESDLEDIFYYGLLEFGQQQSTDFLSRIKRNLESLCRFEIGTRFTLTCIDTLLETTQSSFFGLHSLLKLFGYYTVPKTLHANSIFSS